MVRSSGLALLVMLGGRSYLSSLTLLAATWYLFEDGIPWVFLYSSLWKMKASLQCLSRTKQEHVRPWLLRGAPILGTSMQRTTAAERNALYIKYRDALSKLTGTLPAFAPPSELLDSLIVVYESVLLAPASPLEILEDYIDETLSCARLHKWLGRLDRDNVSPLALTALHEMLFTVALIPSRTFRCTGQLHPSFPISGDVQRFAFSLFSRQLVIKVIKEVTRNAKTGLRIILLSHVNSDCLSVPPLRRWLMLSLMNYSLEVRQKAVKDPLWDALLNLSPERQVQWVTAASGHMEQVLWSL